MVSIVPGYPSSCYAEGRDHQPGHVRAELAIGPGQFLCAQALPCVQPFEARPSGVIAQDGAERGFRQFRVFGVARYRCTSPIPHAASLATASTSCVVVASARNVAKGHV